MANVLIPIDYSFPSHNAYHFGLYLAEKMGLGVVLVLHTEAPPVAEDAMNAYQEKQ